MRASADLRLVIPLCLLLVVVINLGSRDQRRISVIHATLVPIKQRRQLNRLYKRIARNSPRIKLRCLRVHYGLNLLTAYLEGEGICQRVRLRVTNHALSYLL